MTSGGPFFALALGLAGAVGVFALTRHLGAWFFRRSTANRASRGTVAEPPADDSPEAMAAAYRRVLVLRLWALLLCLGALVAWVLGAGWLVCALPAGLGCGMLYLAHRRRTEYVLCVVRQRQTRLVENGAAPVAVCDAPPSRAAVVEQPSVGKGEM